MRLERNILAASGLITIRRIVESDGSFAPVDSYMSDDRTHIWRREAGESAEEFNARVVDGAEWLAVQRGRKVALLPLE